MSKTLLIAAIIVMMLGALPSWPHSRSWGYGPAIGLGVALAVLACLMMMGKI